MQQLIHPIQHVLYTYTQLSSNGNILTARTQVIQVLYHWGVHKLQTQNTEVATNTFINKRKEHQPDLPADHQIYKTQLCVDVHALH